MSIQCKHIQEKTFGQKWCQLNQQYLSGSTCQDCPDYTEKEDVMDFKVENIKALDKNKVYAVKLKFSGIVSNEVFKIVKEKITDVFLAQGISVIVLVADYHFDSELLEPINIDKNKLIGLLK